MSTTTPERLLPWSELAKLIPFHRVHVARLEKAGDFPMRLQLGKHRVAWKQSEVTAWIDSRARGPLPITPDTGR